MTRDGRTKWLFAIYMIGMMIATLAPPPISPSNGYPGINLIPVTRSLSCFVPDPGQPSTTAFCTRIILGNIALFFPFGLLFPLVFPKWSEVKSLVVAAIAVSVSIEVLQFAGQFLGSPRWSDVDDVLFNLIGALFGYLILISIQGVARWRSRRPA